MCLALGTLHWAQWCATNPAGPHSGMQANPRVEEEVFVRSKKPGSASGPSERCAAEHHPFGSPASTVQRTNEALYLTVSSFQNNGLARGHEWLVGLSLWRSSRTLAGKKGVKMGREASTLTMAAEFGPGS